MEWLSQNWIWVVVGMGVVWLLTRGHHGGLMGGGCGTHAHEGPAGEGKAQRSDALIKDEKTAASSERPAASQRHGRGGCC